MGLNLQRQENESLDDYLDRFRGIVRSLPPEEGELLAGMLRNKAFTFDEIIRSFEAVHEFEKSKKEEKAK